MIRRFLQVTPGLYRGSAPSPQDVLDLKDNYGVKKIVSLDEASGNRIDRSCKILNIKHIMLPIDGTKKSLLNFLRNNFKELLIDGGPTFVHCKYGKDRTGLAVALFKCKYMGISPQDAIKEAKKLGFGIGVDPHIIKLYENIIKSCKPNDINDADIVSLQRENVTDTRSGLLDEGHRGSFAPYLDQTKHSPFDNVINDVNEQSPTRENYEAYKNPIPGKSENELPLVGQYNNGAGMYGAGPLFPAGGFISD